MADASAEQLVDAAIAKLTAALEAEYISPITSNNPGDEKHQLRSPCRHIIVPTGTYGYSLWYPRDDIHLVCLSVNSLAIFWALVAERLEVDPKYMSNVNNASIRLSSLDGARGSLMDQFRTLSFVHQVEIHLHYCPWPLNFTTTDLYSPQKEPLPDLPPGTNPHAHENYLRVRDVHYVACRYQDLSLRSALPRYFQMMHTWARAQGILSERHNLFLNSDLLFWLLLKCHSSTLNIGLAPKTNSRDFFEKLSKYKADFSAITSNSGRRLIPRIHTSFEGTTIHYALETCASWDPTDGFPSFCDQYRYYFRIDGQCWASSPTTRRLFLKETMLNCLQYVVQHGRVWPDPLVEDETSCTYVMGSPRRLTQTCLDHCHALATGDCSITISLMSNEEVNALQSASTRTPLKPDEGDILSVINQERSREDVEKARASKESNARPRASFELVQGQQEESQSQRAVQSSATDAQSLGQSIHKLPTEQQVLSRLRYDPYYAGVAYELGYLDRFEGLKWMPLEQWETKPVEDETFIPLTRIRMFRRRDDGVVIWERGKRLD